MATLSIVEHLYVLEQIGSGFVSVAVANPDDPFALEKLTTSLTYDRIALHSRLSGETSPLGTNFQTLNACAGDGRMCRIVKHARPEYSHRVGY